MNDQEQSQQEEKQGKGTTLKSRAPAWVDIAFKRKDLILAYKQGYRVYNAMVSTGHAFDLDEEFILYRQIKVPPPLLGKKSVNIDRAAMKTAFAAGAADAEDHAPKTTEVDLTDDMFEEGPCKADQEGTE